MKSKIFIALLLLFLIFSTPFSATKIILDYDKVEYIELNWQHNYTDIYNKPDSIEQFILLSISNEGDSSVIGFVFDIENIGKPPLKHNLSINNFDKNKEYYIGVMAIDYAYNESGIHWSYDSTAKYGGWSLSFKEDTVFVPVEHDTIPPSKAFKLWL